GPVLQPGSCEPPRGLPCCPGPPVAPFPARFSTLQETHRWPMPSSRARFYTTSWDSILRPAPVRERMGERADPPCWDRNNLRLTASSPKRPPRDRPFSHRNGRRGRGMRAASALLHLAVPDLRHLGRGHGLQDVLLLAVLLNHVDVGAALVVVLVHDHWPGRRIRP